MVSSWRNTTRSIFLEQQKTHHIRRTHKHAQILLRLLHRTKQPHIHALSTRIIQNIQQKKELCSHHGQRGISQNTMRQKPYRRIRSTHPRRAYSAILPRTQPNRNLLESHKKRSNQLTIFLKNRRHARSTRKLLDKTHLHTKLYRILMSLTIDS